MVLPIQITLSNKTKLSGSTYKTLGAYTLHVPDFSSGPPVCQLSDCSGDLILSQLGNKKLFILQQKLYKTISGYIMFEPPCDKVIRGHLRSLTWDDFGDVFRSYMVQLTRVALESPAKRAAHGVGGKYYITPC